MTNDNLIHGADSVRVMLRDRTSVDAEIVGTHQGSGQDLLKASLVCSVRYRTGYSGRFFRAKTRPG